MFTPDRVVALLTEVAGPFGYVDLEQGCLTIDAYFDINELVERLNTMVPLSATQERNLGLSDEFQRNLRRFIEGLTETDETDHRMLAIARTQMELGFMALNKGIANPKN